MALDIDWHLKVFQELSINELYDLLRLRQEVFVLEQQCLYADSDKKDQTAIHLLGYLNGELTAYSRLFASGNYFTEACSFGRAMTAQQARRQGIGKQLVIQTLKALDKLWPNTSCKISAQSYLQHFYEELGFERRGEEYLEDDIPHVAMWRE